MEAAISNDRRSGSNVGAAMGPPRPAADGQVFTDHARSIMPADNPKRSVTIKLSVVARRLSQRFDRSADQVGLSRARYGLIAAVARYPGATQRQLAKMLEVTEAAAGRMVERLCLDGYLERRMNPADRRGHFVHLTALAEPVLATMREIAESNENQAFVDIDDEELVMLDRILKKIAGNIAGAA
jgi:MarR family transcriptional regulator for hemolysin